MADKSDSGVTIEPVAPVVDAGGVPGGQPAPQVPPGGPAGSQASLAPAGGGKASPGAPGGQQPAAPEPELTGELLPEDADALDDDQLKKYADKHGVIHIPFGKFSTRINRAKKASLIDVFGTDDRTKIKGMKDEYEAAVNKREEERRAKLEETDRLKEDARKEKERADTLQAQIDSDAETRLVKGTVDELSTMAGAAGAQPKFTRYAVTDFKEHLKGLEEDALEALTDTEINAWFATWVKDNPEMAKGADAKKTITDGAAPADKPAAPKAGDPGMQKTLKPGQPGSMTRDEVRAAFGGKTPWS
jgi:hypothetical protein